MPVVSDRQCNKTCRNLRDLCLRGTLAPEIGNLVHIRAIILRDNTFSGVIPEEIGVLKELEVLDLGYNNFSGTLPYKLGNNFLLAILLVDNNELLTASSAEIRELTLASESRVDENHLSIAANKLACKVRYKAWYVVENLDSRYSFELNFRFICEVRLYVARHVDT
ncbi:Protein kinase domain-containing protein [Psidium guajava]|nr:Protein kinase domain-containing protein [Psidium guajava]